MDTRYFADSFVYYFDNCLILKSTTQKIAENRRRVERPAHVEFELIGTWIFTNIGLRIHGGYSESFLKSHLDICRWSMVI